MASHALLVCGSFGGEKDRTEGLFGLSWRRYLWGWRRQAGRGAVQSAGLGHVSCAGPARSALPGFKGPGSAKLPSRPLWLPLSPTSPKHRGRRAPFLALASPTLPVGLRCARPSSLRALSASGPFSWLPGAPSLSVLAGTEEETLPLRAFYFKYLMIGPERAESIFSVYHMWRANHGFWRLDGAGSLSRRCPRRLGDSAPDWSRDGLGDRGWSLRLPRGAASSICARTLPRLAQTNPRQRSVGLMIKYLVSEITRPESAVSRAAFILHVYLAAKIRTESRQQTHAQGRCVNMEIMILKPPAGHWGRGWRARGSPVQP